MEIDVFREADDYEEDIALDEFTGRNRALGIGELKKIGLDTGRAVLAVNKEDLVRRTELEEETVEDLFRIIKSGIRRQRRTGRTSKIPATRNECAAAGTARALNRAKRR